MRDVTITVSQLNRYLKAIVEESPILSSVSVRGEISNYVKYNKSGHIYMTLKDDVSSIKVVIFNRTAQMIKTPLENGMNVIVFGKITVYDRDGNCQIIASSVRPEGIGDIYVRLRLLKEQLQKEGLFNEDHKKPIPKFPCKIGVVTSRSGAALQDIRNTVMQRYPICKLDIYPVLVQGKEAVEEICCAVEYFSGSDVDTILIARGGGSQEDLFTFNSEKLARLIYDCPKPVISAIGHETDVSVLDLVADARASTPTFGAMIATPDKQELFAELSRLGKILKNSVNRITERKEQQLAALTARPCFSQADHLISVRNHEIEILSQRLQTSAKLYLEHCSALLQVSSAKLEACSPLNVLTRGYAVLYSGDRATDGNDLTVNDRIRIRTHAKWIDATVNDIKEA